MRRAAVCWLFGCVLAVIGVGCGRVRTEEAPLRLGYTPAEETVADREGAAKALAGYLQRCLGRKVVVVRTASYGPAVEAMARGEVDVVGLGPFAYVLAAERGVAEALVTTGTAGHPRTYESALIAHRRSGLMTLDDLQRRASSLTIHFTDPASNSGYLVPQAFLLGLGLDPERSFAHTELTLSHSVSILNVMFGRADVAGVNASALRRLVSRGRVAAADLTVLWTSQPLPSGPIAVRTALPLALKQALQTALVELPQREPETWRIIGAQYSDADTVYLRCDDSLYAELRALARRTRPN